MTGDQLEANIYIGPTYYMRLKHMVKDKINYRARGPNTSLTRQPVQGRANDGGLRIGEMERDGILSHGMSYFLNESFLVRGDEFYIAVCNKTGAIAIYNDSKNLFLSPYADGPIQFVNNPDGSQNIKNLSKFGRSFSILRVPYSLKLLMQELQVMNVQMRIITDDNIDQLLSMSYSDNINKLLQVGSINLKEVTKKYVQDINAVVYKENNVNIGKRNVQKETPSIPEPVTLTSEEQELEPIEPYSPPYAPHGPDSVGSFELGNNTPGTPQPYGSQKEYESPPYAPVSSENSPLYAATTMPGELEKQVFTKIPIISTDSSASSASMPGLEATKILSENNSTPNIEVNPNILEVESPKEVAEEKKDEDDNNSKTKKINISEDTSSSSSPDDSKKITF
jgi:hypothetical protein